MTFRIRKGGVMVDASTIRYRSNGGWVTPSKVYRRQGGAWVQAWASYTQPYGSASPSHLYKHNRQTTQSTITLSSNISASGGSGSYTIQSWSKTGTATVTQNGWSFTVSATGRNSESFGTVTVVLSDGVTTFSVSFSYEYYFGTIA